MLTDRAVIKKRIYNFIVVGLGGFAVFIFGYCCIAAVLNIVMLLLLFSVYGPNRWPSSEVIFAIPVLGGLVLGAAFIVYHLRRSTRKPPPLSPSQD
ncbi:MAG TPA: hypothetical protein VIL85_17410 [Thermomicrobiales bacterium]|jgi:hypothetical protein